MVAHLSRQEERGEDHKSQLNAFFSVLEERFLDINPYCRSRAIQVYTKLCDLEMKFPKRRLKAAELANQSLEDKSSNERRNAIKLLGCLLKTHPCTAMHGAALMFSEFLLDASVSFCQLLGSMNMSDVIEAMDYFEIGDAYNFVKNMVGI